MAKRFFRDAIEGEIPNIGNVERNISAMLLNTYRANGVHPKISAQIDIGGAHLTESYSLKSDLRVYFAFFNLK